jgi:hypothetical protein
MDLNSGLLNTMNIFSFEYIFAFVKFDFNCKTRFLMFVPT